MKSFTELCLESGKTNESFLAMYLDDQISEEELIINIGALVETYAIIALNMHLANAICYELSYPILVAEKPTTQDQIDEIFERLGL